MVALNVGVMLAIFGFIVSALGFLIGLASMFGRGHDRRGFLIGVGVMVVGIVLIQIGGVLGGAAVIRALTGQF